LEKCIEIPIIALREGILTRERDVSASRNAGLLINPLLKWYNSKGLGMEIQKNK